MNKFKKKIEKIDLIKVFIRSNLLQGSWNFERMQSLGFCYSLIPIFKKLYDNDISRKNAVKRHLEFFNTHPYMSSFISGIIIAIEEKKSNNEDNVDDSLISSTKIGLMGPLAGIGDSLFWGTIRPMLSVLASSISISGSVIGPIIFFVFFNSIRLSFRYYGIVYGYNKGIDIICNVKKNILDKINEGSSIVGLFIMGALVNKWTKINISFPAYKILENGNLKIVTFQNILDKIIPGLIPLLLTFFCMFLLKKDFKPIILIYIIFLIGIFGYNLGILS